MVMAPVAYPVTFEVDESEAQQSRLSIAFRWLLVIPHVIVLAFLSLPQGVVLLLSWFTIIILGRYPRWMYDFNLGCYLWGVRVNAYAWLLTEVYPPFSFDPAPTFPVRIGIEEQVEERNRITVAVRSLLVLPHIIIWYFLGLVMELLGE